MSRTDVLGAVSAERDRQESLWGRPHAHGYGSCASIACPDCGTHVFITEGKAESA